MKNYIIKDEWNIIEEGFDASLGKISESIFSIGNGKMGQRANFEEQYSGDSFQGSYVAGIYYPDKTRVGWWKNGYPAFSHKVINATNWIGLNIDVNGEALDLGRVNVTEFHRMLNMKEGYLKRTFIAELNTGIRVKITATRFCSIVDKEAGTICYEITPLNLATSLKISVYLDGDVKNEDANYDEKFWIERAKKTFQQGALLTMETKRTGFWLTTAMQYAMQIDGEIIVAKEKQILDEKFVAQEVDVILEPEQTLRIYKYAVNLSSENYPKELMENHAQQILQKIVKKGYDQLKIEQAAAWKNKWEESDVLIEGDIAAQQAIRFNIFQLYQTYTGEDARLNIGPKGFTGEKYGGVTYWDTEAYCLPFYLATANQQVARNLLIYRYKHLEKAYENARMLGFSNGAALYPMVTIDGTECHNEWEITFEELHRNGAIAFAIYNYIRYTGEHSYLEQYGLEVLVGIARFWAQRVSWSAAKQQYMLLGITGPNEYENNVNNNWYTNTIAVWCLKYAREAIIYVKESNPDRYEDIAKKLDFREDELSCWKAIEENMYYPEDQKLGIFLQQDGYLDKEQILVKNLPLSERPLNQKWSWDRILRSCFIKQADVLQGLYFFEERYSDEVIRRNYDFYEARTVHESSLSPCVHAILAAKLGDEKRAYEFYLRTARLDLDDYNNDTEDGLHITSMAGSWMSIVEGFAGLRVRENTLHFKPFIPEGWQSYTFRIRFRNTIFQVKVSKHEISITNQSSEERDVLVHNKHVKVPAYGTFKGELVGCQQIV
ncbi:glycoside hydrolase family 65 protein [Olivibacter sp. SDN3]|uniref:family 65 glycosyl hydrolase domain-containing protein n=1 Tax=Olivibacter sp. SDN3 TaxID=2764720 RepID=UPI0016511544|nr:family 65 glycosyl hydrolase domain-containing protein [Olivibacter sp. SDN3]QNL49419.1 glycoside hydrolase family 65 protein [Olivibacter sp. SDN3]